MKIVDNKGRLFGLINLIDLIVIILAIAVAGSVISGIAMKGKGVQEQARFAKTVTLKIIYRDVPKEIAENKDVLKSGDTNIFGKARVENVAEIRPGISKDVRDVAVVVKADCVVLDNQYYCGNVPVKIGRPFTFSAYRYELSGGTIVEIMN